MSETATRPAGGGDSDEELYRLPFLRADTRRGLLVIVAWACASLFFISSDHHTFGFASTFWWLVAVRVASIAGSAVLLATLLRSTSLRAHDRGIALALALLAGANLYIGAMYPAGTMRHGALVAVIVFYLLPGPLLLRALAAVAGSLTMLWFTRTDTLIHWRATLIAHAAVHTMGVPLARHFEEQRRRRVVADLEGKRARAELAEKARNLEVANELAASLARAKSVFLASISHEIRTPMSAVLGLSDALAETPLSAEQRDLARTIHDSAESLLVLLDDILHLTRLEAGRMTFEQTAFEPRALVRSAVNLMQRQAAAKGLTIEVSIAPDVPACLLGDAARLRQILVNLLSNAVKFTDQGSVTVACSSRPKEGEALEIVFAVRDTGRGIAPDLLGRLFQPFERGDFEAAQHGSGLGLMIVGGLIRGMGGTLHVESAVGQGSTFEFVIPARVAELPASPSPRPLTPLPGARELGILLVEDDDLNRRVALTALSRLGCRADVACDGREALAAATHKEYDLILMDLCLPEWSGIETCQRIFALPSPRRRPRVVALTARVFDQDRAAVREAGMDGFLGKPLKIEMLHAELQRTLTKEPAPELEDQAPVSGSRSFGAATLDSDALDRLRDLEDPGEPGFFAETCRQFVTGAAKQIARAAAAASGGDAETAGRAVHILKSMSGSVGALHLAEQCAALEDDAERRKLSGFGEGVARLREELARVERALIAAQSGDPRTALPRP